LKVHCRPGATPLERLEAYLAFCLCHKPDVPCQLADLLVWAANVGPIRERAIRQAFSPDSLGEPAEALGMARAVLLLCGMVPERCGELTGQPRLDYAGLLDGTHRPPDLASPTVYAVPSLLEAYHRMGAGHARGVDRVFLAVTGQPFSEHLRRALALLDPVCLSQASSGG